MVLVPPELEPVNKYVAVVASDEGDPTSEQSDRSETPGGSAAEAEQEVIRPPVLTGAAT